MKVMFIPFVIGTLGTVTKEYWEESERLEEICCYLNSRERPLAYTDVKNSQGVVVVVVVIITITIIIIIIMWKEGGARCVMVIVVGNGHGDTSSNPGRDWLHFT